MDRRTILHSAFAGFALQVGTTAQEKREAILVPAGEDRSHDDGTIVRCKLSGRDTGGQLAIFGGDKGRPGGVPLHVHHDQDEWWYVLAGEHLIQIGDKRSKPKRVTAFLDRAESRIRPGN